MNHFDGPTQDLYLLKEGLAYTPNPLPTLTKLTPFLLFVLFLHIHVFLLNQGNFPLFDARKIQCVYQRFDPTLTHHFLCFTNKQHWHWVDPNYKLFESENNYQQSFRRESRFTPVPYLNVWQGLMIGEMNQLPTVINSHTPTHLSELHNVHLTAIYKSFWQTNAEPLPTQGRFGVYA